MAHTGAGIFAVDVSVEQPIECHRRRTRGHHGHNDPKNLPTKVWRDETFVANGQQCASERKRERKHRVLKLDHVEREAQLLKETLCHRRIRLDTESYTLFYPSAIPSVLSQS